MAKFFCQNQLKLSTQHKDINRPLENEIKIGMILEPFLRKNYGYRQGIVLGVWGRYY